MTMTTRQSTQEILRRGRAEPTRYPYRRVWRSATTEAALLLLCTVLVLIAARFLPTELGSAPRRLFAFAFAALPAALWYAFSLRAEVSAEMTRPRLLNVAVISGLAASGIGIPLAEQTYGAEDWLSTADGLTRLIGYMLTVGLVQEFLKFAVLRFTAWPEQFRTRQDAIAYALAAGLGYATALNLALALGTDLQFEAAALRITEITLAQVAITPILGLVLYQLTAPRPFIFFPALGLLIAAALNSLSIVLRAGLVVAGVSVNGTASTPLFGLGMGVFLVGFLFSAVGLLVRSADERDRLRGVSHPPMDDSTRLTFHQRWAGYLILALATGGILGGFVYRARVIDSTYPFINRELGITARYPERWLLAEAPPQYVLRAQDPAGRPYKTTLQVVLIPTGQGARPADILDLLDVDRAARLPAYRSLSRTAVTVPGGGRGQQMTYAYAFVEPNPFLQAEPITVRAVDIVLLRPGQAIVITYEDAAATFDRNAHYFEAFLRTLSY